MSYDFMLGHPWDGETVDDEGCAVCDEVWIANHTSNIKPHLRMLLGECWRELHGTGHVDAYEFRDEALAGIYWWESLSDKRQDAIRFSIDPINQWGDMNSAVGLLRSIVSFINNHPELASGGAKVRVLW